MFSLLESFTAALAAIRAHALRSILTTLGIIIGVAAVIAVVSVIQGFAAQVGSIFQGMGTNTVTVSPHLTQTQRLAGMHAYISDSDLNAIRNNVAGISNISPLLYVSVFGGAVSWHGTNTSARILGTTSSFATGGTVPETGRFIVPNDNIQHRHVCVIGRTIIKNLYLSDNPIGSYIKAGGAWCRIVGILKKRGKIGFQDLDNIVILPYTTARSILGTSRQPDLRVQLTVNDVNQMDATVARIQQVVARNHRLQGRPTNNFEVQTAKQAASSFMSIVNMVTFILGGIVAISLLVGGIGIANIMLVSVTERTREIGILKALGARRRDILLQFLIESVVLSVLGGIIGIILGWLLGILAANIIPGIHNSYVPGWAIALAFGVSGGTGIIFGILPAAKAANLNPIDALRYE
jgi:putative ABC transport system permease protein